MAEPYLKIDANPPDPTSDEALERALEKVRAEARARVRHRKKIAAEAAKADAELRPQNPDSPRQSSQFIQRKSDDRRSRPRSTSPDRRKLVAATQPLSAAPSPRKSVDRKAAEISGKIGVRPALIFGLALAIICAAGMLSIRAIHSATPPIEGFSTKKSGDTNDDLAGSETDATSGFNHPVTAALMRTQGWVLPSDIQTIDRALARARRAEAPNLAPEVALVPVLDMDIETGLDLAFLTPDSDGEDPDLPLAPPPPLPQFGSINGYASTFGSNINQQRRFKTGPRLALPPMRPFGGNGSVTPSAATDPLAGPLANSLIDESPDNSLAIGSPPAQSTPASSMIEDINQSGRPQTPQRQTTVQRQPERPVAPPKPPATLAQLQEASCARLGFFSRVSCKDEIRADYCKSRSNKHPDCARLDSINNF